MTSARSAQQGGLPPMRVRQAPAHARRVQQVNLPKGRAMLRANHVPPTNMAPRTYRRRRPRIADRAQRGRLGQHAARRVALIRAARARAGAPHLPRLVLTFAPRMRRKHVTGTSALRKTTVFISSAAITRTPSATTLFRCITIVRMRHPCTTASCSKAKTARHNAIASAGTTTRHLRLQRPRRNELCWP